MGFLATLKAQKAAALQTRGDVEGAKKLYKEAIDKGMNVARYMLAYSVLLLRSGEYQEAKALLAKIQKAPGLTAEQKVQLFMNYAVCCYKMGDISRGVELLERQHLHQPTGMVYESLGYLYVEKYLPEKKPVAQDPVPAAENEETEPLLTQEELDAAWAEGIAKARAFLAESVEYDDEDAVCLDNMGQFCYRVLGDKAEAKMWFDKAIEEKPGQIDTLWFLSRYDLDNGDKAAAVEKLEKALEGRFSPLNYCTKESVEAEIERLKA